MRRGYQGTLASGMGKRAEARWGEKEGETGGRGGVGGWQRDDPPVSLLRRGWEWGIAVMVRKTI